MTRLSKQQRAALQAVADGRVMYGSAYPASDRRAWEAAVKHGRLWAPQNDYLIDGTVPHGAQHFTWASLDENGWASPAWDEAPTIDVPERIVTRYVGVASPGVTGTLPARRMLEPGARVWVRLTDAGREALG